MLWSQCRFRIFCLCAKTHERANNDLSLDEGRVETMIGVKRLAKVRAKASTKANAGVAQIDALPLEYVSEFNVGDDIKHPQFGTGVILVIAGEKLHIHFADDRQRQVLDSYVVRV